MKPWDKMTWTARQLREWDLIAWSIVRIQAMRDPLLHCKVNTAPYEPEFAIRLLGKELGVLANEVLAGAEYKAGFSAVDYGRIPGALAIILSDMPAPHPITRILARLLDSYAELPRIRYSDDGTYEEIL